MTGDSLAAVRAVSPLAGSGFPQRVTSVTVGEEAITLRLRSGLELRLGEPIDLELKLAVAAAALPQDPAGRDISRRQRPRTPGRRSRVVDVVRPLSAINLR